VKTEGQIRHKLVQVRFRHLKQTLRNGLSRRPENCVYNRAVEMQEGEVHFCGVEDSLSRPLCDAAHGGLPRAAACPLFECRNNKEELRRDFFARLKTATLAELAQDYPDMVALLWTLGDSSAFSEETEVVDLEEDAPEPLASSEAKALSKKSTPPAVATEKSATRSEPTNSPDGVSFRAYGRPFLKKRHPLWVWVGMASVEV
jgi:hypothetical protein